MKLFFDLFRKALNGARRAANQPVQGRRPTRCAPFCIEDTDWVIVAHGSTRLISVANRANNANKRLVWPHQLSMAQKTALKTIGFDPRLQTIS